MRDSPQTNGDSLFSRGEMIHGSHFKAKGSNIFDEDSLTTILEC
jgi:hypothetical protein